MSDFEDVNSPVIVTPQVMATEDYANSHAKEYDAYIKARLLGMPASIALRRIFGEDFFDTYTQARIYAIESTEYYSEGFAELLHAMPISKLWNEKKAIHELLCRVNDVFDKGSTRLNAIRELNVLIGITIVDENGRTRKGSSLGDFYKSVDENKAKSAEKETQNS